MAASGGFRKNVLQFRKACLLPWLDLPIEEATPERTAKGSRDLINQSWY